MGALHAVDCASAQHILLHILVESNKRKFSQNSQKVLMMAKGVSLLYRLIKAVEVQ